jgi:hypothetical protein
VDAGAERRQQAHAPVAELVAEALDHDRAVVGEHAGGGHLLLEVGDEVAGRPGVEVVLGAQPRHLGVTVLLRASTDLALEGADRPAELRGAAGTVAVPERQLARLPGGGRDDDPVVGDVLDPPGRRAEHEGLARARLVDHLLVELADPGAVRQEHPVQATVGDRARVGHGQPLRAGPGRTSPLMRSHTTRGRSSLNSSDG